MPQNIFYTQEGNQYILKTANKFTNIVGLAPQIISADIYVNVPMSITPGLFDLLVSTNRKIIPLSYSLSVLEFDLEVVTIDISTPYMVVANTGTSQYNSEFRNSLNKKYPYINRNFYTSNNFYNYFLQYNQLVFSENDFINSSTSLTITPMSTLAEANTSIQAGQNPEILIAGNYIVNSSFNYFELL